MRIDREVSRALFLLSSLCTAVFCWSALVSGFEDFVEMIPGIKADLFGNLRDGLVCIAEEPFCYFNSLSPQFIIDRSS